MDKLKLRRFIFGGSTFLMVACVSCGTIVSSMTNDESVTSATSYAIIGESTTENVETNSNTIASTGVNTICPTCGQAIAGPDVFLTYNEIKLLASLVELEVGIESYDCKKAVASVVINRMRIGNKELTDVIYEKNQFSVADRVSEYEPTKETISAVKEVLTSGVTIPEYVTFFRAGQYHDWGDQIPYIKIDNTYFSYSLSVKEGIVE